MTLVTFENLGRSYGNVDIFKGLSGAIQPDNRIGLVGANGSGKTTFVQLIAGVDEPTDGTVTLANKLTIGYLRQEAVLAFADTERALYEEMESLFDDVRAMEQRMRDIEDMMADGTADTPEYDEYGELQEDFERRGGYDYERRIEITLLGLGFEQEMWNTQIKHLSGGQKTRALLARLLIIKPDLLILDEPTNHLDVDAIAWLDSTLKQWDRALLIISHDRYFLENAVNMVWEMTTEGIDVYRGNYSAYINQRDAIRERISKEWDALMERFWNEFTFIEKKTLDDTNAKGRFKVLSREVEAVRVSGLDALKLIKQVGWGAFTSQYELKRTADSLKELRSAIKSLENPLPKRKDIRVKLEAERKSGITVLKADNFAVGYDGVALFTTDDIDVERGETVALIGGNGTGKSTFLKTLMEQIKPITGKFSLGHNVQIGYFAQAHDGLIGENQVIEELMRHKDGLLISEARHILAQYLFRGDDVFKKVSAVSGGERGRLALAILALSGANFLILDEPTNHLDIPAQEIMQDVLENFAGTILLVSHDRYLIDHLATQIWEVKDGHMTVFKGDYQQYLARQDVREKVAI